MDNLVLILIIILLIITNLAILYFQFKNKPKQEENVAEKFKDEINSIRNSFSESFGNMSKDIAKDMSGALSRVDEKVQVFNKQVEDLNKSQENFSRILAGVKHYGILSEFSLGSLLQDLLPASQYIENVQMKPDETNDTIEFCIKLQDVLLPVDSHWPIEKFKEIDNAYQSKDKEALAEARKDLAAAFRTKAKSVSSKYIAPPKSTSFAIIYAPTEGLFAELSSYRDPKTKQLLLEELRTKYNVTVTGPNTLSALLQAYQQGFTTLKIQQHATQIYNDLKLISRRFEKHFDGIIDLRKKLEQAMTTTDSFGRDARSIMNTLNNIKDPETVKETVEENSDKIKVLK